jgi:hypothetical protein
LSGFVNPNIFIVKRDYFRQLQKSSGWSGRQKSTPQAADSIHFSHPEHGTVSIIKDNNQYHVKHNGALAGIRGQKGVFDHPKSAVEHAKAYIGHLNAGQPGKTIFNTPSAPHLGKADPSPSPSPNWDVNKQAAQKFQDGFNQGPDISGAWNSIKSGLGLGKSFGTTEKMHPTGKNTEMGQIARKQSLQKLRALKKPNLGKSENIMSKSAIEQAKDLIKALKENPSGLEELSKAAVQHIKGVHMPIGAGAPGMSEMGKINSLKTGGKEFANSAAKHQVKQISQAAKTLPKPKLGKEEIKEIPQEDKKGDQPSGTVGVENPKNVDPLMDKTGANPDYKAPSEKECKEMVNKASMSEKGVHKPAFMHSKKSGTSDVGARMAPGGASKETNAYAKEEHKKVLAESKAMPKPNLGKEEMGKSAFKTLQHKIERKEGYSPDRAAAITASIGRKELGQAEMTRRSKAGMHKKAEGNPDMKQDAQLGEQVEHAVESHMMANAGAEAKEGHPMAKAYFRNKLAKCGVR